VPQILKRERRERRKREEEEREGGREGCMHAALEQDSTIITILNLLISKTKLIYNWFCIKERC
jgi:hypothetical protein